MHANQVAFDKVAKHLLKQGRRASDEYGNCFYAMENSELKCAIGALLCEEEAIAARTVRGPVWALIHFVNPQSLIEIDQTMLHSLQIAHDSLSNWHPTSGFVGWKRLHAIALNHNLSLKILTACKLKWKEKCMA